MFMFTHTKKENHSSLNKHLEASSRFQEVVKELKNRNQKELSYETIQQFAKSFDISIDLLIPIFKPTLLENVKIQLALAKASGNSYNINTLEDICAKYGFNLTDVLDSTDKN